MKLQLGFHVCLMSILLLIAFADHDVRGDDFNNSQNGQLVGSLLSDQAAVEKSEIIFVGQVLMVGVPSDFSPGLSTVAVKVKVQTLLKGKHDLDIVFVGVKVRYKAKMSEKLPESPKEYIFFATTRTQYRDLQAVKIIPATDESIARIKALIAAAPAPK